MKKLFLLNILFGFGLLNCADGSGEPRAERWYDRIERGGARLDAGSYETFCFTQRVAEQVGRIIQKITGEKEVVVPELDKTDHEERWSGLIYSRTTDGSVVIERNTDSLSLITPWGKIDFGSTHRWAVDYPRSDYYERQAQDIVEMGEVFVMGECGYSLYRNDPRGLRLMDCDGKKVCNIDSLGAIRDRGRDHILFPNSGGCSSVEYLILGFVSDDKEHGGRGKTSNCRKGTKMDLDDLWDAHQHRYDQERKQHKEKEALRFDNRLELAPLFDNLEG